MNIWWKAFLFLKGSAFISAWYSFQRKLSNVNSARSCGEKNEFTASHPSSSWTLSKKHLSLIYQQKNKERIISNYVAYLTWENHLLLISLLSIITCNPNFAQLLRLCPSASTCPVHQRKASDLKPQRINKHKQLTQDKKVSICMCL